MYQSAKNGLICRKIKGETGDAMSHEHIGMEIMGKISFDLTPEKL